MAIITGQRGANFQPTRYGLAETGEYFLWTYVGTRAEIEALIPGVVGVGGFYEVRQSYSGAADVLEARFASQPGATEAPINTWELFSNEVEKDIFQSDIVLLNTISDDEKKAIQEAIENPTPGKSPALTTPNAIDLYLLMLNGLRAVRVTAPVVRHTQTVSSSYTVKASLTNVGRIMSTNSFISLEGVPSDILFNLPTGASSRTGLVYGWYKRYPLVRAGARAKMQIEQEWEYGLWPPLIYGALL